MATGGQGRPEVNLGSNDFLNALKYAELTASFVEFAYMHAGDLSEL